MKLSTSSAPILFLLSTYLGGIDAKLAATSSGVKDSRHLQDAQNCALILTDWVSCQINNCANRNCEPPTDTGAAPDTGDSEPADCDALTQDVCTAFNDDCCPECAATAQSYRDCFLAASFQLVCPGATCDGVTGATGGDGGDSTTGSPAASPTDSNPNTDVDASTPVTIPQLPTAPPATGGTGTDDNPLGIDFCEEEIANLESCADEKCPTCEDQLDGDDDVDFMSSSGLNCNEMGSNFCSSLEEGKKCCSGCQSEINAYYKCAEPLFQAICPDVSCDGISSSAANGLVANTLLGVGILGAILLLH